MRIRLCAAAAVSLALVAAGCSSKGEAQHGSTSIEVGAPVSLTGSLADEGHLTQNGYQLCQKLVNAKGGVAVGSKHLKLDIHYQDDTSQPDVAAQIVDHFNDQGIKLVLSPYGSASTAAAAPVVERNGQLMADSLGTDNAIFEQGYKRTFGVMSPASEYAGSMVKAIHDLAKQQPKTVVFLSADDGFSKQVAAAGVKDAQGYGWKVLSTQYYPANTSDVSTALTKIKSDHPDVIFESGHVVEGVALIKQAHELGVHPSGGFAETVAPPTPQFVQALGSLSENVIGSSQWVPEVTGSDAYFGTAQAYAAAYDTQFHDAPDYHAASASAACLALVLAVQKAGSTNADKVRDAIASLDTDSFYGHIKFDTTGLNSAKPMDVIQIQHGKVVTVWPQNNAKAPLVWPAKR